MKTIAARLLLPGLLCAAAAAQPPAAVDAAAGAKLFQRHCGSCHGKGGHGGRAPDLTTGSLLSGDRDADVFRTISNGIPGSEMASYSARLRADEIRNIVAFLRSNNRPGAPPSGDAAHGQALFWGKGGCGNCHAVGTRGDLVGPDLTGIGRRRSLEYLRQSLVNPSADIVRGYDGLTVVAKDGRIYHGIEKDLDDFSAILQDFSGKIYSFDRSRVRSVTRDEGSLMPAYGKVFSETEMNDVLAYLFTLGRSGVKP